jgi:hypothetical protein
MGSGKNMSDFTVIGDIRILKMRGNYTFIENK